MHWQWRLSTLSAWARRHCKTCRRPSLSRALLSPLPTMCTSACTGLVTGHACLDSIVNTVLSFINHVHVSLSRCGLVSAYADLWFGCQCLCSNMPVSCFCSHCNVVTCVKAEMRLFCLHTCLSQQWTSCTTLDISALKRAYSSLKHRSLSSSVPKTQCTLHVKLRLLPLVLRPPPDLALPCWKRCSVIVL
jgi:hypothetical protein